MTYTIPNLLLPLSLLTALPLYAQTTTNNINDATHLAYSCAQIQDNYQRLACFDRIYTPDSSSSTQSFIQPDIQSEENQRELMTQSNLDLLQQPHIALPTTQKIPIKSSLDLKESYLASKKTHSPQIILSSESTISESPLSALYDLDQNSDDGLLSVREHNPMYILPIWYNSSPNYTPQSPTRGITYSEIQSQQKRLETKMQISFKTKLMEDLLKTRADLWFGYTQQSNWQIFNQGRKSAPFRNTDYSPELFLTQPVKSRLPFGGQLRMLGFGIIHQSNGQSRPLSRSWNRAYIMAGAEWGKLSAVTRLWSRLDKKDQNDDNPNIGQYLGYGDLRLAYHFNDYHNLTSTLRYNPHHQKGALQLDYSFQLRGKLKAYLQFFHGYGENLSDYNHRQTGIGLGLTFQNWDGI